MFSSFIYVLPTKTLKSLNLGRSQIGIKGAQFLADGLQNNTVNRKVSFDIYVYRQSFFSFITQTIQRLFLEDNGIGEVGTRCIAKAIKSNKVINCTFCFLTLFDLSSPTCDLKTLTTLGFGKNQIGSHGAKYLSAALQNNSVTTNYFYHIWKIESSLFCRRSNIFFWKTMESVMRAYSF